MFMVRSEVGSGLLYWCNARDVLQFRPLYHRTGYSVLNPAPIIGLFSSPTSNLTSYLRGVEEN